MAEDKILRDPQVGRTVNIIVHTMQEVNEALSRGQYFFTDIVRDGVLLYELPNHPLANPAPPTAKDAYELAQGYLSTKLKDLDLRLADADVHIGRADLGEEHRKWAAFVLHQAVETAYACFLLVRTLYFPRSHNIKFLRSLAEQGEPRLISAWPREQRADRRRFELLKRAYVEARYSTSYEISAEDLLALASEAAALRDIVETVSRERLDELRRQAGQQKETVHHLLQVTRELSPYLTRLDLLREIICIALVLLPAEAQPPQSWRWLAQGPPAPPGDGS